MSWGGPEFVLIIIAISTGGWVINNWIRARHGYALEDEWGGKTNRADQDTTRRIIAENEELRGQVSNFGERVKVLERIITDKGYDLGTQIEALRDTGKVDALPDGQKSN